MGVVSVGINTGKRRGQGCTRTREKVTLHMILNQNHKCRLGAEDRTKLVKREQSWKTSPLSAAPPNISGPITTTKM